MSEQTEKFSYCYYCNKNKPVDQLAFKQIIDHTIDSKIAGVDSFQAFLLAGKTVKTLLLNYINTNNIKVQWLGSDNLGLEIIHEK